MKLVLGILAIVVIAATLLADYKWRQWLAARKLDRQRSGSADPPHRHNR